MVRALSLIVLLRALSLAGGEVAKALGYLDTAETIDPISFDIREVQVEALMLMGRRDEAVLAARDARRFFPGLFQAQSAYATALAMHTLHGYPEFMAATKREARAALEKDPAGWAAVERLMFLLAAEGAPSGLDEFRRLGVYRLRINGGVGLVMRCRLCGRHWMAHRLKSALSSNSRSLAR